LQFLSIFRNYHQTVKKLRKFHYLPFSCGFDQFTSQKQIKYNLAREKCVPNIKSKPIYDVIQILNSLLYQTLTLYGAYVIYSKLYTLGRDIKNIETKKYTNNKEWIGALNFFPVFFSLSLVLCISFFNDTFTGYSRALGS